MKINHSFQINSLLKMIPPPPHFLENYFAEVKIKKLKTITNHFSSIFADSVPFPMTSPDTCLFPV